MSGRPARNLLDLDIWQPSTEARPQASDVELCAVQHVWLPGQPAQWRALLGTLAFEPQVSACGTSSTYAGWELCGPWQMGGLMKSTVRMSEGCRLQI